MTVRTVVCRPYFCANFGGGQASMVQYVLCKIKCCDVNDDNR